VAREVNQLLGRIFAQRQPSNGASAACPCNQQTHYRELRAKRVLTAMGSVQVSPPYYLCPSCHAGQFPADRKLDMENTELSPGVRRMLAMVEQEAPFYGDLTAGWDSGRLKRFRGRERGPGNRAALRPLSPLRTGRESFPSSGSSTPGGFSPPPCELAARVADYKKSA